MGSQNRSSLPLLAFHRGGARVAAGYFCHLRCFGRRHRRAAGNPGVSINANGDIAGIYLVGGNVAHGFVRAADGTITKFDASNAGTGANQGTFPLSINSGGDIAGMYFDTNNVYHGFVRDADGTITEFDVPGAGTVGHRGTEPISINTAGDITGIYTNNSPLRHGFVRAASGAITTFDVTGAGTAGSAQDGDPTPQH